MKLFYDKDGRVVGSIEGMRPGIEDKVNIPGCEAIEAPREVRDKILDPHRPETDQHFRVSNGKVVRVGKRAEQKVKTSNDFLRTVGGSISQRYYQQKHKTKT